MTGSELLAQLRAEGLPSDAAEGAGASSWSNGPGDRYTPHEHGYDKVLVATSGAITFELPDQGRSVTLKPGGRLELRAGTRHAALVGPSGVACLELHLASGSLDALGRARATSSTAAPPYAASSETDRPPEA
jgi:quercetin dioxygenase-like cupin family protein